MSIQSNTNQNLEIENDTNAVIKIKKLHKGFGSNSVLIDFNLNLYPGENVVVLGKSGSGKSVLIKCIIGLMKPDKGSINVLGNEVPELEALQLN